jgi:hypothetical protein
VTTTLKTVRAALTDLGEEREDITAVAYDDTEQPGWSGNESEARIFLTRRTRDTCIECGQPLPAGRPGPVTWFSQGQGQGTHNHEHGCGVWNLPEEVQLLVEHDDLYKLDDLLAGLVDRLDTKVTTQQRESDATGVRVDLIKELRTFLRSHEGDDEEDILPTGSDVEPGVYREGGRWVAWNFDPRDETETITVTEDDLPQKKTMQIEQD